MRVVITYTNLPASTHGMQYDAEDHDQQQVANNRVNCEYDNSNACEKDTMNCMLQQQIWRMRYTYERQDVLHLLRQQCILFCM